ncbi:dynein light intermediate chain [Anaeramoeba ignava]|uniref:Dynein light intermediate chain n=1 Tax=Anaeramoeba ignava TaxID=1746090 RepID=A0A9Q0LUG1_ANAIG|nr:dynein light intermediate chain [Anaeramoeba ignava]
MSVRFETVETETGIWEKILNEVRARKTKTLDTTTLVVLGKKSSGKSTFLSRFCERDKNEFREGIALDYSYLEVRSNEDDIEDVVSRTDIWQLENGEVHKDLLQFSITPNTAKNLVVVIMLDLSDVWNLLSDLEYWLKIIEYAMGKVFSYAMNEQEMKNRLVSLWKSYKEPDGEKSFSTPKTIIQPKLSKLSKETIIELPKDVLIHNLGIPIIVACSKSDIISDYERKYRFTDSIWSYVQAKIRRMCLNYGAGLVYISGKEDYNLSIFKDYILHLLYGFEFNYKAQIIERERIFIPIGWDSDAKIKLLTMNTNELNESTPYNEAIPNTKPKEKNEEQTSEVVCLDDQEFLKVMSEELTTTTSSPTSPFKPISKTPVKSILKSSRLTSKMYETPKKTTLSQTSFDSTDVTKQLQERLKSSTKKRDSRHSNRSSRTDTFNQFFQDVLSDKKKGRDEIRKNVEKELNRFKNN